jgi:WD40 repeat protein
VWRAATTWSDGGRQQEDLWPDYPRLEWFVDPRQRQLLNRLEQSFLEESEALRFQRAGELVYERDRARDAILMSAARRESVNPTRVAQLLREVTYPRDTRGWYSLAQAALRQPIAWMTVQSRTSRYAFSRDERCLATTGPDGAVHVVWLTRARDPLVLGPGGKNEDLGFALSPDGKLVATVSYSEVAPGVTVWRTDKPERGTPLEGHESRLFGIGFSPDGRWLFTGSEHGTGRVWRPDGHHTLLLGSPDTPTVYSVAADPAGRWLAVSTIDEMVRLIPLSRGAPPQFLEGHDSLVLGVAFSSDGRRVVSASMDRTARVWGLEEGRSVVLRGHRDWLRTAVFGPGGRDVLTTSDDGTARVWDQEGRAQAVLEADEPVAFAVFHPLSDRVIIGASGGSIRMWDLERGRRPEVLRLPSPVAALSFSRDGRLLAIATTEDAVMICPMEGRGAPRTLGRHGKQVTSIEFSPDGSEVLTASKDGTVRLWPTSGDGGSRLFHPHEEGEVTQATFVARGESIATAGDDGTVRLLHATGRPATRVLVDFRGSPDRAKFSPTGDWILVHDIYGTSVQLRRVDGAARQVALPGKLASAMYSDDGGWLAMLTDDGALSVRRLSSPTRSTSLGQPGKPVRCFAVSPDGGHVLAAFADGGEGGFGGSGTLTGRRHSGFIVARSTVLHSVPTVLGSLRRRTTAPLPSRGSTSPRHPLDCGDMTPRSTTWSFPGTGVGC